MKKSHEFTVARDLYNEIEVDIEGEIEIEVKLVKKDLKTKWFCKDIGSISGCEQTYNENGNIRTEYCKIIVDGQGEKLIRMRYKEAKKLIETDSSKVGFKK